MSHQVTILQPPALKIDSILHPDGKMLPRCRVERRVVWNLLSHLAAAGFTPRSVESDEEVGTDTPEAMMEELFNLDEAHLHFFDKDKRTYWVFIVLGNDGWDAISDWGVPREDPRGFNAAMEAFDPELYV